MAKYKVENDTFRHKGKAYGIGDEITLSQSDAERFVNLGYIKEVKSTTASAKGAAKGASKTAKGASKRGAAKAANTDTATLDTNTNTSDSAA